MATERTSTSTKLNQKGYTVTKIEKDKRKQERRHLFLGIPQFELKTAYNKHLQQGEFMKFILVPEEMHHDTWIDRNIRFWEKMDRMFDRWEVEKNIKTNQLTFDEILDSSLPSQSQMDKAHRINASCRVRNGMRARKMGSRVWADEAPSGTMFFGEQCSSPRPSYWWLPRLSLKERAVVDRHIALEVERGEWD